MSQKLPILVVDDDDAIQTMVERVLRREQFEVESARDGFEAIEKLTRKDYGTVLLDLMMPRVDGHGVLRFLEKNPRPAKVIVMTANLQGGSEAAESEPVFRCSRSRSTSASSSPTCASASHVTRRNSLASPRAPR